MPYKKLNSLLLCLLVFQIGYTQDMDALKERKENLKLDLAEWSLDIKEAQKELEKVKEELKFLEDSLKIYPIWSKGVFGTLGFNFTRFQDWLSKKESNTAASTLGFTVNSFFNLEEKKYFWKNTINLNQSWLRFDNKENEEENGYQVASDAFNLNSLWGYKLNEKLAASALLQYRTALLQKRLNNPAFLDTGFGLSWTPKKDMVIAFHPLNYNAVFSKSAADLNSSFGLKILGEYSRKFLGGISWTTNFSSFLSYKSGALNNWIWSNGLSKTVKKIGIGLDMAFKQNRQEAKALALADNPFQFYYILGLSYKF